MEDNKKGPLQPMDNESPVLPIGDLSIIPKDMPPSNFQKLTVCKEETLKFDLGEDKSIKTADEFMEKSVQALDNCIETAKIVINDPSSSSYTKDAAGASIKRMEMEKVLYKTLNKNNENDNTPVDQKEIFSVSFGVSAIKQNESALWERARLKNDYATGGTLDPYNYWTVILVVLGILFFLKFLSNKKPKDVKKEK